MKRLFLLLLLFTLLASLFTLQTVYAAAPPAPVPQTGQTTCYDTAGTVVTCAGTGQDGENKAGVHWPQYRFTDNFNGTVTDNLTGLIWLKNANCFGPKVWTEAITAANSLANGACGLSHGSSVWQWRLPTIKELESLVDLANSNPALPIGHPFTAVHASYYWSSSSIANDTYNAWYVSMNGGFVGNLNKFYGNYVWPVRSGQ